MYPELFHIGPIPIRSYGVMLVISFFAGVLYMKYVSKRYNKPFETYLNIAYIMIFGGIIGARLSYVLLHLSEFSGHWTSTFNPFGSEVYGIAGLNLYGGVLLAVILTYIYCRYKKLHILEVFDDFSPTLGIGLFFTRIGCFLNGCCFGTPSDIFCAVKFPIGSIPFSVFGSQHIHPSQLYSSLYGLLLFLILHFKMRSKKFTGQLIAILFMVEAAFRFAIEYVRYYEDAMNYTLLGVTFTFNQVISVSLFLLGLIIYLVQNKKPGGEAIEE
jgi:phosphatidylglycerol:prolipoprotein diacylglycerol transferase